jgi:hypothetical protein
MFKDVLLTNFGKSKMLRKIGGFKGFRPRRTKPTHNVRFNRKKTWVLGGIQKDPIDHRDYIAMTPPIREGGLPSSADLRPYAREIEDQGHVGSCVGNAVSSELELYAKAQYNTDKNFARLFIYYNARKLSGLENQDGGAYLRDGVKCCNKYGICTEDIWPYDTSKVNKQPSAEAYEAARPNRVITYERINVSDITTIKSYLANENKSVVLGMGLGEKFYGVSGPLEDQNYPAINDTDNELIGGHAMNIVGYNDNINGGIFIVENSWGTGWGDNGYFALKYSVWESDGWDCWVTTNLKIDMLPDDPDYTPEYNPDDPDNPVEPEDPDNPHTDPENPVTSDFVNNLNNFFSDLPTKNMLSASTKSNLSNLGQKINNLRRV